MPDMLIAYGQTRMHPRSSDCIFQLDLLANCRFRLDLATLREGDQTGAQAAKEALENRQRQDARQRKEAGVSS